MVKYYFIMNLERTNFYKWIYDGIIIVTNYFIIHWLLCLAKLYKETFKFCNFSLKTAKLIIFFCTSKITICSPPLDNFLVFFSQFYTIFHVAYVSCDVCTWLTSDWLSVTKESNNKYIRFCLVAVNISAIYWDSNCIQNNNYSEF